MLFSGTINTSTGIFGAIELAKALHTINQHVELTIIGYAALPSTLNQLKTTIAGRSFITLIGGDQLVPHADVINAIHAADFGIICYPPNPSTANTIPTKLYEYMGSQLPILLINHKPWTDFCAPYNAAVVFDPDRFDASSMLEEMLTKKFYAAAPQEVYWEGDVLLRIVNAFTDHGSKITEI